MRRLVSSIAAVALLALAACKTETARAAPPPTALAMTALAAPADCDTTRQACYLLTWTWVSDGAGNPDGYVVTVARTGGAVTVDTADASPWPVRVDRPAVGSSLTFSVSVAPIRRGLRGASASVPAVTLSTADAPPPAVTGLTLTQVGTGSGTGPNPNPPAGDVSGDSLPSPVGSLFAVPRATSPHFDFARYTWTDFCYCLPTPAAYAFPARKYDLVMSGNLTAYRANNPTMDALRYTLMQTVFTEEPDTNGKTDADNIVGKWQYDARAWFAAHPQYSYESMWLHDTTTGTPADSAHRLRRLIWKNYRYAINPMDAGARAYTVDRLRRVLADIPAATGLFLDEMDAGALSWIATAREGRGVATQVWQDSVVSLVSEIRRSLAPAMIQTNAAAYSTRPFDRRVGVAAGAMHLEQLNKATQDMPGVWAFVDGLLRDSVYVDLVNLETFQDFARYKPNFYPPGNYADAVGRGETFQLASYYMVVDSGPVKRVGLHDNGQRAPVTPDSTDLAIYYLDVGQPKAPRYVWAETTDALGQTARTYRRDFTRAVVLIRPVTSYKYPVLTDTTAVPVPLPSGGPWSMVMARGQIVPVDSLRLRNSEAVILVRRQ